MSNVEAPAIVHFYTATAAMELLDDERMYARMLEILAAAGHLILFDKPGIGASDPFDEHRDYLEQLTEAYLAVLDELTIDAAWLFGGGGLPTACLASILARDHPDRLRGAVLVDPVGRAPIEIKTRDALQRNRRDVAQTLLPSRADDPVYRSWSDRAGRLGASATAAKAYWEALRASASAHLRQAQPIENTPPVQLIHRRQGLPEAHVEWWAGIFPEAEILSVEGADRLLQGLDAGLIAEEAVAFITGRAPHAPAERELAAILFTDLVQSTTRAAAAGDAAWRSMLDRYEYLLARSVERHRGRVVKNTGDGALAIFTSATMALQAAYDLRSVARELGLRSRAGVHVGEVEIRGSDVGGIAVHLASRVMDYAGPDEVLVTSTAVESSLGSDLKLVPRGSHTLKGIERDCDLFALDQRE
ncbi:MAG: adenylate/guanylate cyclase domain-containing protein [Acidimicrobiia bacterium]|nr:adenylate/guanylate cyclase domain-containing protein [Acidimicrobiia bacterium]